MDGISVAASFVGLIAMAAKITLGLNDFITWVKEAPNRAGAVLREVADISACLGQVQSLLLGTGRVNASNQSLLMVDEINVVLSNCVLIFSELEQLVEGLKSDRQTSIGYLRRWATVERAVAALLLRLQYSKTSLSLMISTMSCRSIEDAQTSVAELAGVVRKLLESNQSICEKLSRMEMKSPVLVSSRAHTARNSVSEEIVEDNESIMTVREPNSGPSASEADETQVSNSRHELECLLKSSRPYIRASKRPDASRSTTSSVVQTLGWSCLSGISLAEVSNISIIELALDKNYTWKTTNYDTLPRYLGTIAEGNIIKIYSDDVPPLATGFGSLRCRECDMGFHREKWACHSFDDNWWHLDCVRCNSCNLLGKDALLLNALGRRPPWKNTPSSDAHLNDARWKEAYWREAPINFYQLKTLTCSTCLPDCYICRSKSTMYPVFEGEEAICGKCMSDTSPCEICGAKIWNRGFLCFFEGTACFHHRNLLIQKAPHMVEFFDSDDRSDSPVSLNGTSSALAKIDEPMPFSLMEGSIQEMYSQFSGDPIPRSSSKTDDSRKAILNRSILTNRTIDRKEPQHQSRTKFNR